MIKSIGKLLLVLLCCHLSAKAQPVANKDSLLQKIAGAKDDSSKVKLYYLLAAQYYQKDLKLSEKYCLLGLELSKKIKYHEGVLSYYTYYGDILNMKGDFDSLLRTHLEAWDYAKKHADSADIGRTMLNVAIAYEQLEDYENAVDYIEGAKAIFSRNNIHQYEGFTFNLLQVVHNSMHQYRKAANDGLSAIAILVNTKNNTPLQQAYNNLASNYINLHLYDSAKYYLIKAERMAVITGETQVQITINLNYALIALRNQQLDSLKLFAGKALSLSRQYKANEFVGYAMYGMAYYYLLTKDYPNAKLTADSAMLLANQYNLRDVKQKLFVLQSSIYYAMQNNRLGYQYFYQYELLSDSILNESIGSSTVRIEKKYEIQKKEAQIQLQQAQLKEKSTLNYLLMAGAVSLLVISLLFYRNYKSRQKLQQVKIDELETEKQLTATQAVLKGEEQERTRLAKDLHDGLGGMLSGIKYSFQTMKENLVMTPDNAQAFERSIDMLDSSINEMRRVAHNMMPELLFKYGLDTALKEFCKEINSSGLVRTSYHSIGMDKTAMDQKTMLTVYRVVQELLNNVMKHAAAKNVLVQLHAAETEKILTITVEDDGKGFDISTLKQATGIGWSNIRNRISFLKGKLDVQSAPNEGTSVLIEINI